MVVHATPPAGKRPLFPNPELSILVGIVWLLANNTLDPGHLLLALLLGWLMPWVTYEFWPDAPRLRRPTVALGLFAVFAYDILIANLRVAVLVLGPNARLRPAFLEVPIELGDPVALGIFASMITLTPGTVSADVSPDRKTLIVHALDVDDPAQEIANIKRRYEAPLKEIFGC